MRFVNSPTLQYVEYERGTLAMEVPFFVTHREARLLLERERAETDVLITFYLEVRYEQRVIEPHPDCEAPHAEQTPKPVSLIRCEAFPDVLPEHRPTVESFGIRNRVVRIPLVQRPVVEVER